MSLEKAVVPPADEASYVAVPEEMAWVLSTTITDRVVAPPL